MAGGGIAISYCSAKILAWAWNGHDDEHYEKVTIELPHDQTEEIEKWPLENGIFNYKPANHDAVEVKIDGTTHAPTSRPSANKQPNGDIVLDLGDLGNVIKNAWGKVLCRRAVTAQCVANFIKAIMRVAQIGGPAENVLYIDPYDFPRDGPNIELYKAAMKDVKDYEVCHDQDTSIAGTVTDLYAPVARAILR